MSDKSSIPNIFTMNPDELVRMFKDQPETFYSLRTQSRDAHRLTIPQINDLRTKAREQINTMGEVQSGQTREHLYELIKVLDRIIISYQEVDALPPFVDEFELTGKLPVNGWLK